MALSLQGSLFDTGTIGVGELGPTVARVGLPGGAWVDVRGGWLQGADELLAHLVGTVPWEAERRRMYDRVVDVPRLGARYPDPAGLPHPALLEAKAALDEHYRSEFGEPFATAGLAYYRDGQDSVAWHGDTFGRERQADTMVAIVVLGQPRPFLLRPRGGGAAMRHLLGHGDLIVMGGSCQRTWQHAVPKSTRAAGPRISVQFRTREDPQAPPPGAA